jgi:hypothetical protein
MYEWVIFLKGNGPDTGGEEKLMAMVVLRL